MRVAVEFAPTADQGAKSCVWLSDCGREGVVCLTGAVGLLWYICERISYLGCHTNQSGIRKSLKPVLLIRFIFFIHHLN